MIIPVCLPDIHVENALFGLEFGPWEAAGPAARRLARKRSASGESVTITHWLYVSGEFAGQSLTVDWSGCRIGIGSKRCDSWGEAVSKLRKGLAIHGHFVFGDGI